MKIRMFVAIAVLTLFLLSFGSFAAGSRCRCDRLLDSEGLCTKCGEMPSKCVCYCWCGRSSELISVEAGEILICSKCGSSCSLCSCSDKQTAQRLEAISLERGVVMETLPLPENTAQIVCFVVLFGVTAGMLWIFSSHKKNVTVQQEAKTKKRRREHSSLMDKIDSQSKNAETPKKKSDVVLAVEKNIKWPVSEVGIGMIAYELTNAVEFHGAGNSTVTDITLFSYGSYLDDVGTLESAFKGSYGQIFANLSAACMAARSSDGSKIRAARPFFDDNFFEENELSISTILGKTGIDESSVHLLLKLPFETEVRVGNSEPQVQRLAREKSDRYASEESADSYLSQKRFPDISEKGREKL